MGKGEVSSPPTPPEERWEAEVIASENRCEPETHTVYVVEVKTPDDSWNIWRRYSDFKKVKESLEKKHRQLVNKIPFPSKKAFGSMKEQVVVERKNIINKFLLETLGNSALAKEEQLLEFLSPRSEFELQQHILRTRSKQVSDDRERNMKDKTKLVEERRIMEEQLSTLDEQKNEITQCLEDARTLREQAQAERDEAAQLKQEALTIRLELETERQRLKEKQMELEITRRSMIEKRRMEIAEEIDRLEAEKRRLDLEPSI